MVNMIALGGGILTIIVGGVLLLVGAQIFAQLDTQFNCDELPYNTSTDAQQTCESIKSNVWLILGIAPYGLVFTGLFLVFGTLLGKF